MRYSTLATMSLCLTTTSVFAAPDVQFHDFLASSTAKCNVNSAAGAWEVDSENQNLHNWPASLLAVSNTSTPGAVAHAHSAVELTPTEFGFTGWGYASTWSDTEAAVNAEASVDAIGGFQLQVTFDRPTRVTAVICAHREGPADGGYSRIVLNDLVNGGAGQQIIDHAHDDGADCIDINMMLAPSTYEINMAAWLDLDNNGIGAQNGWAETSVEFKFVEMPNPDITNDGKVNGDDLTKLLGAWGSSTEEADLNGDGVVDGADLTLLLGDWTG